MNLASFVRRSARRDADAVAVRDERETLSYGELDALSDRVASALLELGVRPGDRVALWAEKSARVVAAMQAILRVGAAYVPIDPLGPALRASRILDDCQVRCVVTTAARYASLADTTPRAALFCDDDVLDGETPTGCPQLRWSDVARLPRASLPEPAGDDALAYVLYTSGSTGTPKGVCLSHRNAIAFVDDMVARLAMAKEDRLSNHAPFHFDLSVFDLYAAFRVGASVSILSERAAYAPRRLVEQLERDAITIWYSVPSALIQMMLHGGLGASALPSLRAVLFAGEVFPMKHLAALRRWGPDLRLLNLYGPTETNVCAIYEVGDVDEASGPIPIGHAASGDRLRAVTDAGVEARIGEVGELMVEGPTVMLGYWGRPPQGPVYATGDLVQRRADGAYVYLGRRDHMVKVRGYRIELGEVEAALSSHPAVQQAAVIAVGESVDARLVAFVVAADRAPSLVALKAHLAERLPSYMNINELRVIDALPRTSTGKIDRLALQALYRDSHREPNRSLRPASSLCE